MMRSIFSFIIGTVLGVLSTFGLFVPTPRASLALIPAFLIACAVIGFIGKMAYKEFKSGVDTV